MHRMKNIFQGLLLIIILSLLIFPLQGVAAATLTVCASGCDYTAIQAAVNGAAAGDTILVGAGTYAESVGVAVDGITFTLDEGVVVSGSSPAFTINGDDVTIQGGILDGGGTTTDPGILVNAGADNFILRDSEITGWRDGVELAGSVTSFKVYNNWFHENAESGLQVNSGVVLDGVVTVEGNLFKENGGAGIQNDSGASVNAEYNSWGHIDGPASGDTISVDVDADPWTYFEIFMDVEPDTGALEREMIENESVDVALKVDAEKLYGLSFKLNWDGDLLTFNSVTFGDTFWQDRCTALHALPVVDELSYRCNLEYPDVERDTVAETLLTINVTANGSGLTGNGPWESFFDISHLEADTSAGGVSGVKIWVNNAGFGDPSAPERDISDADDGKLIITGIANYSGTVILEGRNGTGTINDNSGATVTVYSVADKSTSIAMASATSAVNGSYYTAHLSPQVLILGNSYALFIDRDLYLPTTVMAIDDNIIPNPTIPTVWYHSKLLTTRLYTPLNRVTLLGGDATNDDVIDVLDAGCIGRDYGSTPASCGSGGTSDVNGDGVVDMLDLTLMAGNYTKNYSPWNP